jgi:putative DNA methylase
MPKRVITIAETRTSSKGNPVWLEPVVDRKMGAYRFRVRTGTPTDRGFIAAGTKVGKSGFRCLLTDDPIPFDYVRTEAQSGRLGLVMLAIVAERPRGRLYLEATDDQVRTANLAVPSGFPDTDLPEEALGFRIQNYGIRKHWQMFTPRQLTAIVTISDLAKEIRQDIVRDSIAAGLSIADANLYAETVATFLALALDRCADFNNALCRWSASNQKVMNLFGRGAIPMVLDFAEANILAGSVGGWSTCTDYVADCIEVLSTAGATTLGQARQVDAATGANGLRDLLVSTDPPYYDNIGYAALSDFFYVWLRRTIGEDYSDLFSTVLVPKLPELTASPERFDGDKERAKEHFETGFRSAFTALRDKMDPRFPLTVYYAFKQDDEESGADQEAGEASGVDLTTGWETLLEALIASGFQITGTWPVRASQAWRMRAMGANALASYVVLACRPRQPDAPQTDRRSFVAELKRDLPSALRHLQQGNIAPVDFAQAAIGPGMAIYSRYRSILESSGKAMTVRTALSLINQTLTEVLSEQEDEFDADTRWAIAWFHQLGFAEGDFGEAEVLSKAKVTSVAGLQQAGLIRSKGGKVRLLRPDELPGDWSPATDKRLTIWEMTHHLLRVYYHHKAGDEATAALLRQMGSRGEVARDLAYRLFDVCEKEKRSQEAQAYNALVLGWPEIARLAREGAPPRQEQLFGEE